MRWIRAFWMQTLYSNVHKSDIVVDGLVRSLEGERAEVAYRLAKRLSVQLDELAPYIEKILAFWGGIASTDDETLELRFCLFEAMVNSALGQPIAPVVHATSLLQQSVPPMGQSPRLDRDDPATDAENETRYLEGSDAITLVNRISAFVQISGELMNVAIDVVPAPEVATTEKAAQQSLSEIFSAFCRTLEDREGLFACAMLIERGEYFTGRLIAHVPVEGSQNAEALLRTFCSQLEEVGATLDMRRPARENGISFHWDAVLELCAGAQDDGASQIKAEDLRDYFGIPRGSWKNLGPLSCPPILYSDNLSADRIRGMCTYGVKVTPAFTFDKGRRFDRGGWELKVHDKRAVEIAKRKAQWEEISSKFGYDAKRLAEERLRLQCIWGIQPEGSPHASK